MLIGLQSIVEKKKSSKINILKRPRKNWLLVKKHFLLVLLRARENKEKE